MDEFFASHSIYKTVIVCDIEDSALRLLQELIDNDHTVTYIIPPERDDPERPAIASKFRHFASGGTRVLIMSYASWHKLVDMVEDYAMDHNLLILHGLEGPEQRIFMEWLVDARERGFAPSMDNYHVLIQEGGETFSVHHD